MKSRWIRRTFWIATIMVIIGLVGSIMTNFKYFGYEIVSSKEQVTVLEQIAADKAKIVDVNINFGVGELQLEGGADHLMEADFRHTDNFSKPQVDYREDGEKGTLRLSQKNNKWLQWGQESINQWNIRLDNEQPVNLHLETGAGINRLQLGELSLRKLSMELGVSDTELDLRGDWKQGFDAEIESGVGKLQIHLPTETGVKVKVVRGLGDVSASGLERIGDYYQNKSYETAEEKINIIIDLGVGEVELIADES